MKTAMSTTQPSRRDQARQFIEALPHCQALAMTVDAVGDGEAVMSMPYSENLIGDPKTGVIHGGAVSALMDTRHRSFLAIRSSKPRPTWR